MRPKIVYIDHSFHERTASTRFVYELLEKVGDVVALWDDSWSTGRVSAELVRTLQSAKPDIVVFFQVMWPPEILARLGIHKSVIMPMYDSECWRSQGQWAAYRAHHFVSFCDALSARIEEAGAKTLRVQYCPPAAEAVSGEFLSSGEELSGFYWHRTDKVGWKTIATLAGQQKWREFYVHDVPDPGSGKARISAADSESMRVTSGSWFPTREGFSEKLRNSDVFFAPRLTEGIGMGFLEAMAAGCCVVAPDLPTHNEYIENGVTGLLYDPASPEALDFSNAKEMGEAAAVWIENQRERWRMEQEEIAEFVLRVDGSIDLQQLEAIDLSSPEGLKFLRVRPSLIRRIIGRVFRRNQQRGINA